MNEEIIRLYNNVYKVIGESLEGSNKISKFNANDYFNLNKRNLSSNASQKKINFDNRFKLFFDLYQKNISSGNASVINNLTEQQIRNGNFSGIPDSFFDGLQESQKKDYVRFHQVFNDMNSSLSKNNMDSIESIKDFFKFNDKIKNDAEPVIENKKIADSNKIPVVKEGNNKNIFYKIKNETIKAGKVVIAIMVGGILIFSPITAGLFALFGAGGIGAAFGAIVGTLGIGIGGGFATYKLLNKINISKINLKLRKFKINKKLFARQQVETLENENVLGDIPIETLENKNVLDDIPVETFEKEALEDTLTETFEKTSTEMLPEESSVVNNKQNNKTDDEEIVGQKLQELRNRYMSLPLVDLYKLKEKYLYLISKNRKNIARINSKISPIESRLANMQAMYSNLSNAEIKKILESNDSYQVSMRAIENEKKLVADLENECFGFEDEVDVLNDVINELHPYTQAINKAILAKRVAESEINNENDIQRLIEELNGKKKETKIDSDAFPIDIESDIAIPRKNKNNAQKVEKLEQLRRNDEQLRKQEEALRQQRNLAKSNRNSKEVTETDRMYYILENASDEIVSPDVKANLWKFASSPDVIKNMFYSYIVHSKDYSLEEEHLKKSR